MIRVLPPWFENLGKRLVKSPRVYLRDSGILHSLLGVDDLARLAMHPAYGASGEGFALEQTLIAHGAREAYFYRTQRGAELDLMHPGRPGKSARRRDYGAAAEADSRGCAARGLRREEGVR